MQENDSDVLPRKLSTRKKFLALPRSRLTFLGSHRGRPAGGKGLRLQQVLLAEKGYEELTASLRASTSNLRPIRHHPCPPYTYFGAEVATGIFAARSSHSACPGVRASFTASMSLKVLASWV